MSLEQTRTQSPRIDSFSHWNMGRRSIRAKPFWNGGRKSDVASQFSSVFSWCTANSSNPTHKPQHGQEKRLSTSLVTYIARSQLSSADDTLFSLTLMVTCAQVVKTSVTATNSPFSLLLTSFLLFLPLNRLTGHRCTTWDMKVNLGYIPCDRPVISVGVRVWNMRVPRSSFF